MRFEAVRGKAPLAIAVLLLGASACAPQCGKTAQSPTNSPTAAASPSQSPAATATAPLQASSAPFHSGEVGLAYAAVNVTATGGVSPYSWSLSSGSLPPGMNIGGGGAVAGTPTASGTFAFTIQVSDAKGGTAILPGAIPVAPPLTASLIPACSQHCDVELGCVNVCGAFGQLGGGVGPFGYTLTQGSLPAGTSLSGLSLTGMFVGLSGYLKFTVQVSDALGATATISPTFWMYDHVALASGSCTGPYGQACMIKLHISGGIPNDTFMVALVTNNPPGANQGCGSYGPQPPGSLGVTGSDAVISVPGRWPSSSGYGAIWTVQVTDTALCGLSTYCKSNLATATIEVQCG